VLGIVMALHQAGALQRLELTRQGGRIDSQFTDQLLLRHFLGATQQHENAPTGHRLAGMGFKAGHKGAIASAQLLNEMQMLGIDHREGSAESFCDEDTLFSNRKDGRRTRRRTPTTATSTASTSPA